MRDSISANSNMRYRTHGVSEIIPVASKSNSESCLPRLIRQKASIPSLYCNQNNHKAVTTLLSSNNVFSSQCVPVSSMTPSLSSSISSSFSLADVSNQIYDEHPTTFHHTIPQSSSYSILIERLNRAIIDL
jgi:hypothetical protein